MNRSKLRENIFKIVFSLNSNEFSEEAFLHYLSENKIGEADGEYIKNEVEGIISVLTEIDETIKENLKNYTFDRVSKVCLAVMRVAVYEINYVPDIPQNVAISEAVKLVATYEEEKSKGFVNGILGSISRNKNR